MGRYGWANEDGVRGTVGTITRISAGCLDCEWSRISRSDTKTARAVRVHARRHAALERHRVAYDTITRRHYEPEPRRRAA